ncbi:MAG: sodium:alanine symporter family protein [Clostridia bacterium]|nr:sodium:alanine symporter family protein [Clostridia bacterium]
MSKIFEAILAAERWLNGVVWGWPMIIFILGTGILLTIRTRAMQVRKLGESINSTIVPTLKSVGKPHHEDKHAKSVSQFEAFAAAISGTVGTGNIVGVVSAILTGGPGAVFWMWVSAFFGMITNYAENVLGLFYRKKDKDGNFSGGAFYYIKHGLGKGWGWLAYLAAIFCLFAALGMSGVQTNKITQTLSSSIGDTTTVKLIIGGAVALVTALIILGGIQRIGKVASLLVPFMSLLFIVLSLIGVFMNVSAVPMAFKLIFTNIFGFKAMAGGFGGYLFAQVIKKGMARGVFSNEAGLGSSVIAHSASETREPVKQGLWGIFEVFFDTFIICTMTALIFLTTFIKSGQIETFTSTTPDAATSMLAFSTNFGVFGTICFSTILPLFAFTTIMAWSYYGEKAVEFCFAPLKETGKKIAVVVFKLIYLAMIVGAAVIESDILWNISDTANGLMAIPNLIAVVLLSGKVVKITKNYYARKKGEQVEPMLSAYPEQNAEFAADLKEMDGE